MTGDANLHLLLEGKKSLTLDETDLLVHGKDGSSLSPNTIDICGLRALFEVARQSLGATTTAADYHYHTLTGDSECYRWALSCVLR